MILKRYRDSEHYIVYEVSSDTYLEIKEHIILPICLSKKYLKNTKEVREYLNPILGDDIIDYTDYIMVQCR